MTHCAIRPNPQTISQQPTPIASRATAAVISTATSCGSRRFNRRCNGHTSAMMNRAKATGVITLRASDKAASVRITAQTTAARRSARSPTEVEGCRDRNPRLAMFGRA